MAGKLIVDTIDTDNAFITLNVQQSLIATMNVSGIFSNTGVKMIGANGTVSNTAITGNITSSQITSVANTQITGLIQAAQIGSANASLVTSGTLPAARLPTGSVLQVVSTTLTTGFSTSVNNSYNAVTGLTAIITPTSSSSKIMVFVTMTVGSDTNYLNAQLTKGGTAISGALATTVGSRTVGTASFWPVQTYGTYGLAFNYLDSPATTSATTYGVQIGNAGSATLCVNQSQSDDNSSGRTRGTSTITVMEIAA